MIRRVNLSKEPDAWRLSAPHIEASRKESQGDWSIDFVKTRVTSGAFDLFVYDDDGVKASAVVAYGDFGTGKIARVIALGGSGGVVDSLLSKFEQCFRDLGCKRMAFSSLRNGWNRKLKSHGWRETHVVFEKEL